MRVLARVDAALLNQTGYLFQWSPICLAVGIGLYFSLRFEPEWHVYACLLLGVAVLVWIGRARRTGWAALAMGGALIAAGFMLAGARAHSVAEPVLSWRYYGPIEGRVVAMDRSASDALRVTLDRVRVGDVPVNRRPQRVRLSLHGGPASLAPGQRIMTTGHLSPPQGPVEPGGFDFRRHAWFQGLGAVGYTRVPVMTIAPATDATEGVRITALRMAISERVRAILPGEVGGFAAAVTTGDRSGMGQETLNSLRASNLAHLLAISGLHMGLLTGFVFLVFRLCLSAIPEVALRLPVRKMAASFALVAAVIYLMLSGGNVATERAFVMVSVMLGAILIDRRAISLRAVAVAALIVLILRPESLLSPGFQMSFAATTALVAVFGQLRGYGPMPGSKWTKPVAGLLLSSAIAGLATAPIGAAHFNTMSHYGLLANMLSVPVMGTIVVPAAFVAALLAPFGLESVALNVMGLGLKWILTVSQHVSTLDGAQGYVVSPPHYVLPMIALGALWLALWQGRAKWIGIIPVVTAFLTWEQAHRPEVLIADSGGLVGVMSENGRALSKEKGSGFIATVWLENDGDGVDQMKAASRWPDGADMVKRYTWQGKELIHITGKRAAQGFDECQGHQIVVSAVDLNLSGDCGLFDPNRLKETGSLAISNDRITTSQETIGQRLWSPAITENRNFKRDQ
ncbi:ComEC family competence protein [Ruegeria denitrificans]|uniref:ComEC family competence protein n=1 Tax=Ruegeria denitrificans TaxID=1715692 RepID=A0A0P1IHR3_9RHOB|nr:ComEC/Rec2 family competence protein [Ruegeria denitrificans]CUJ94290.1 ComEC family competence protein [Ruegeria denitrificans]